MSCAFCVAIYLSIKLYLKFIGSMYGGGCLCMGRGVLVNG